MSAHLYETRTCPACAGVLRAYRDGVLACLHCVWALSPRVLPLDPHRLLADIDADRAMQTAIERAYQAAVESR